MAQDVGEAHRAANRDDVPLITKRGKKFLDNRHRLPGECAQHQCGEQESKPHIYFTRDRVDCRCDDRHARNQDDHVH